MKALRKIGVGVLSGRLLFVCAWLAFAALGAASTVAEDRAAAAVRPTVKTPDLDKILAGGEPETVEDLRAMQEHVRKLTERVLAYTVSVRVGRAQGSGVIVTSAGYVLTAAHVVGEPNRDATFILTDGRRVPGKTLGRNSDIDAGLLKITDKGPDGESIQWPYAELGECSTLKRGQWCLATGHPGGYERGRKPVVRLGRVLSHTDSVVMTDCPLVGGDSGGPLFDMKGNVIGVHSRIGAPLTANLHVPVDTYRDTWNRLVNGESWGGTPFIGVEGESDSDRAKIARVFSGGAAEKAGVRVGDIITQFAGRRVTDFGSLAALVSQRAPGHKVKVLVLRGDATVELELVVGRKDD